MMPHDRLPIVVYVPDVLEILGWKVCNRKKKVNFGLPNYNIFYIGIVYVPQFVGHAGHPDDEDA